MKFPILITESLLSLILKFIFSAHHNIVEQDYIISLGGRIPTASAPKTAVMLFSNMTYTIAQLFVKLIYQLSLTFKKAAEHGHSHGGQECHGHDAPKPSVLYIVFYLILL